MPTFLGQNATPLSGKIFMGEDSIKLLDENCPNKFFPPRQIDENQIVVPVFIVVPIINYEIE